MTTFVILWLTSAFALVLAWAGVTLLIDWSNGKWDRAQAIQEEFDQAARERWQAVVQMRGRR